MLREGTYLKHGSQSRLGMMDLTLSIFNRKMQKKKPALQTCGCRTGYGKDLWRGTLYKVHRGAQP